MKTSPHPDAAQLRAYSLGRLGDADSRHIERHLMSCPECKDHLFEVPATDDFVDWLQKVHRERGASEGDEGLPGQSAANRNGAVDSGDGGP